MSTVTTKTAKFALKAGVSSSLSEIARPDSVSTTLAVTDRPPLVVPRSQIYYWSPEWQAGEREAEADLEKGDFARFDNPADAIRWLLDEEDL
jgi:hypothetical protein